MLSVIGFSISFLTLAVVIYNAYSNLMALQSPFRITISTLLLLFAFVITSFNKRLGLISCVFLLPLLPTLTFQILAYTGYGRILHQDSSGLDLICGFVLGCIINQHFVQRKKSFSATFPWPAALLLLFITISVALAIFRNLSQTASPINYYGFLYSLSDIRSLDWHDDFRPIFDWVAYGTSIAAFVFSLPVLKSSKNRNDLVFVPLIFSLFISSVVGLIQNRFGIGLTPSQLQFRSNRLMSGYDVTGFSSVGFQPDIHSYAGVLMMGAIGLLGYWFYSKNKTLKQLILFVIMPLSLLAMLASKSKSSIALTILFLIIIFCTLQFRHSLNLKKTFLGFGVGILVLFASFYFFQYAWKLIFTFLAHKLGFADLYALNYSMAFRPEIFLSAFRMFAEFPLMGLGQGDFYRLSSIPDFSHSYFLTQTLNGENSHNYFIQILAENGLIGFSLFCLLIFYPITIIKNKAQIIPAFIGLCSIFLGNIYSHSLLVRENLILCAFLVSLMYAWQETTENTTTNTNSKNKVIKFVIFLTTICCFLYFAYKEVRESFKTFPFTEDYQCVKERSLTPDGWTSGLFKFNVEKDTSTIVINIKAAQPNPNLMILSQIVHPSLGVISSVKTQLSGNDKNIITINLPADHQITDHQYQAILILQRCYIPKNWGISNDSRRLGIQIESIKMTK
ncbi:O-antigen ligase family protein [Orrella sp. NBD-18]|uniref:O-antigen ligase family protein n=1 Tax=Sheuella amnicola TaxID=2707330 RepID=A0A6B2QZM4_9BURK|nr:O-antigen ligase family protein [Sheuella amnicola]NDY83501.1 O-antigen ligase family protein [Sheuella amnicola]